MQRRGVQFQADNAYCSASKGMFEEKGTNIILRGGETMKCQNCQAEVGPEASFCQECGAHIEEAGGGSEQMNVSETQNQTAEPPSPEARQAAATPPVNANARAEAVDDDSTRPLGIGTYFLMLFVFGIPVVNIIMMIVWTLSSKNKNQKNLAAAALIWTVILLIVAVLFSAVAGVFISVILDQYLYQVM